MTTRLQLTAALVIVQLTTGCGGMSSQKPSGSSPLAPSAVVPSIPITPPNGSTFAPNVTLSGVVSEIVNDNVVPIEGVGVYCEPCGEGTHIWTSTDSKGLYTFTGVWGDHFLILVRKDGYEDLPSARSSGLGPGWREVRINGDTRVDVQLVRK